MKLLAPVRISLDWNCKRNYFRILGTRWWLRWKESSPQPDIFFLAKLLRNFGCTKRTFGYRIHNNYPLERNWRRRRSHFVPRSPGRFGNPKPLFGINNSGRLKRKSQNSGSSPICRQRIGFHPSRPTIYNLPSLGGTQIWLGCGHPYRCTAVPFTFTVGSCCSQTPGLVNTPRCWNHSPAYIRCRNQH